MGAKDSRPSWADFWKRYILSVMAASVAETVTFPLDLTKTRMQIQGLKQYVTVAHCDFWHCCRQLPMVSFYFSLENYALHD